MRLRAPVDDEIWVLAGSGLLAREIADSEGGFEIEPLVVAILDGRAIEMFGPIHGYAQMVPGGWQVETTQGGRARRRRDGQRGTGRAHRAASRCKTPSLQGKRGTADLYARADLVAWANSGDRVAAQFGGRS